MALDEVLAGNVATSTAVFTAASTPSPSPTAVVCFVDPYGDEAEVIVAPTITVNGTTVTVVANWTVPDDTLGGLYVAKTRTSGSFVGAAEHLFRVKATRHVHV
jgi:hypothetical protein